MTNVTNRPRRSFLGFAAATAAGLTASLHPLGANAFTIVSDQGAQGAVSPELEGTWLDTITITDPVPPPFNQPFLTLVTYSRGGSMTSIVSIAAPKDGNIGLGAWAKTGSHQYVITQLQPSYDAQGVLNVWVKIRSAVQVDRNGKSYSSSGWLQRLDTQFNVIVQVNWTSHAMRVDAQ